MQVCQVCLLSMLLYIIEIEVLASFINTDEMIKGIQIGNLESKIINFADDTTIFLWDITCLIVIWLILNLYKNEKITSSKLVQLSLRGKKIILNRILISKLWSQAKFILFQNIWKNKLKKEYAISSGTAKNTSFQTTSSTIGVDYFF